jgi:hypothetical protein
MPATPAVSNIPAVKTPSAMEWCFLMVVLAASNRGEERVPPSAGRRTTPSRTLRLDGAGAVILARMDLECAKFLQPRRCVSGAGPKCLANFVEERDNITLRRMILRMRAS